MTKSLRILLVNHFPLEGSGSGTYTRNLAVELMKRGHALRVIAPDHAAPVGLPFAVDTIRCRADGARAIEQRVAAGLGSTPVEAAPDLPFNFPCFTTHPRSRTTFGQLSDREIESYLEAFRRAVGRALAEFHPDIIHSQHLWIGTVAALESGVPVVVTSHGTDLMGLLQDPRGAEHAHDAGRRAKRVIAVSAYVAERVEQRLGVERERIRVIWNGFDPEVFRVVPVDRRALLKRHGLPEDGRLLILYMGKLARFKGTDVLLRAAARYGPVLEGAMTLIVGEGEMEPELRSLKAELSLGSVHFLGHQTIDEVVRMYNAADLAVVPSRGEPFGLVALEAMACGPPVVATRAGGLADFVHDAVGGLVPVDDPEALANRIVAEIRGGCKVRKGPLAASYALQGFSWSAQVAKIEAVYREILVE